VEHPLQQPGSVGFRTSNIDGIGHEGIASTDYYGQQAAPPDAARLQLGRLQSALA
jgi:hypothetical protein